MLTGSLSSVDWSYPSSRGLLILKYQSDFEGRLTEILREHESYNFKINGLAGMGKNASPELIQSMNERRRALLKKTEDLERDLTAWTDSALKGIQKLISPPTESRS